MIRCGVVCGSCRPGRCEDQPSEMEPLELRCVNCEGKGCDQCDDGWMIIKGCPQRSVGPEAAEFTEYADMLWRRGLTPMAGGLVDQTKSFMDAAFFYRDEMARHGKSPDMQTGL